MATLLDVIEQSDDDEIAAHPLRIDSKGRVFRHDPTWRFCVAAYYFDDLGNENGRMTPISWNELRRSKRA
jgi:hypothetical protein